MNCIEDQTIKNLSGIELESTEFLNCVFENLDFSSQSFKDSRFIECNFKKCNCSNITVMNSSLRDVEFDECKLLGINWSCVNTVSHLKFLNSILDYCVFQELDLVNFIFEN